MITKEAVISNAVGLHARPASDFVHAAKNFKSKITIENIDSPADGVMNAKSIVQVLALAVPQGASVRISADGEDEQAAVEELTRLINSRFGE